MLCCADCIDDRHLRSHVIPDLSNVNGTCSFCKSENQALIRPIDLRDQFELLISIYKLDESGKTLVELLKSDWGMFPKERMDALQAKELLAEILDDGEIVRHRYSPLEQSKSIAMKHWEELRAELMHVNRFFPKTEINLNQLEELFSNLLAEEKDISQTWHRARIQQGDQIYTDDEMGSPPAHLASHGRANPAGIPYLYLASNILTAISEIRPHTGETICVASFGIPKGLNIVDLRHPRKTVSPFISQDENLVVILRGNIEFLEQLGQELTRPVLPKSAAFDYIPSQYLCEYAKMCGYDGVMYRSSVGEGKNIALFDPAKAQILDVSQHYVSSVSVTIAE